MTKDIGLIGNGGQANEIESYLSESFRVVLRAVTKQYIDSVDPVLIDVEAVCKDLPVIAAVGGPGLRKRLTQLWRQKDYLTLISEQASVAKDIVIGAGSVICPNATVTTGVIIGQHVIVNIGATISHDCTVGDYVTISPGVHIAGKVSIGDGVFIGIGAIISDRVSIASGSIIGAGAVLVDDISEKNSVAVGIPAKVIKKNDEWLYEL